MKALSYGGCLNGYSLMTEGSLGLGIRNTQPNVTKSATLSWGTL